MVGHAILIVKLNFSARQIAPDVSKAAPVGATNMMQRRAGERESASSASASVLLLIANVTLTCAGLVESGKVVGAWYS